ncbi:MAG: hybrid sensor histidine kinase/response regulator [Bacteroidales bacterium]|nr:hybrid sensor histidine kinase/response regulator [Bacteroidales bacterium]
MEKLKLLVVDDEPGIRMGVCRILENYAVSYPFMDEDFGFDVKMAETGEEALDILKENELDIVLLDNKLPGIQGIDVLEYINKQNLDVVVVMITSYASLELAVKATRQGAYDFVPKPFTPKELRASIETITKQLFLRRMTQKLHVEGRQVRFQFLSVLSHELKSPLNAIEGYLKMMQDRKFGHNLNDYQEMIDRSLHRIQGMRNLIMDMLDLTRIESGKKKRKLEQLLLCEIVRQCIDAFQPLSIQKDVDVYLNCSEKISIEADKQEIEIVFNNLISNAIKYNKQGGRVDVNLNRDETGVLVEVEDTGIGMSTEDTKHLFEDFVRIKSEHTKHITGSGLGLSITKKILDLYGASIEVESTPGQGSCFRLLFPAEA